MNTSHAYQDLMCALNEWINEQHIPELGNFGRTGPPMTLDETMEKLLQMVLELVIGFRCQECGVLTWPYWEHPQGIYHYTCENHHRWTLNHPI